VINLNAQWRAEPEEIDEFARAGRTRNDGQQYLCTPIFRLLLQVAMYSLSTAKRMLVFAVPVILLALIFGLVAYFAMS
jgi:hypothetical protein